MSRVLGPHPLRTLASLARGSAGISVPPPCRDAVDASRRLVEEILTEDVAVYGVNTGFGKLADRSISRDELETLQRNLVLSHASGVGAPLGARTVRLVLALKLSSLARGASGVRWEILELLEAMLERDVVPVVPSQGSVGASGDLAPLAHLASVLIGHGEAEVAGRRLPAREALASVGLEPVTLHPKEGLALINGTQVSTALAIEALVDTERLFHTALVTGALSIDAALGSDGPFGPTVHRLRGHRGQIDVAAALTRLIAGSQIRESHRACTRVQDPYSLRCMPQVMGACLDQLRHAASVLAIESTAVTDNPLVLVEDRAIVSGGNFHAEPVALVADQMAIAIAEIGSLSERRVALLVDPALSGLPPFLTPDAGVNSGYMIAQVTAAALVSENRQRSHPASVDSIPTSANQEDHVSMATHGARRLLDMVANLRSVLAVELLVAAQGVHLRAPLVTSAPLASVLAVLRERVPPLDSDRLMAPDIDAAAALIESGTITAAVGSVSMPDILEPV